MSETAVSVERVFDAVAAAAVKDGLLHRLLGEIADVARPAVSLRRGADADRVLHARMSVVAEGVAPLVRRHPAAGNEGAHVRRAVYLSPEGTGYRGKTVVESAQLAADRLKVESGHDVRDLHIFMRLFHTIPGDAVRDTAAGGDEGPILAPGAGGQKRVKELSEQHCFGVCLVMQFRSVFAVEHFFQHAGQFIFFVKQGFEIKKRGRAHSRLARQRRTGKVKLFFRVVK